MSFKFGEHVVVTSQTELRDFPELAKEVGVVLGRQPNGCVLVFWPHAPLSLYRSRDVQFWDGDAAFVYLPSELTLATELREALHDERNDGDVKRG